MSKYYLIVEKEFIDIYDEEGKSVRLHPNIKNDRLENNVFGIIGESSLMPDFNKEYGYLSYPVFTPYSIILGDKFSFDYKMFIILSNIIGCLGEKEKAEIQILISSEVNSFINEHGYNNSHKKFFNYIARNIESRVMCKFVLKDSLIKENVVFCLLDYLKEFHDKNIIYIDDRNIIIKDDLEKISISSTSKNFSDVKIDNIKTWYYLNKETEKELSKIFIDKLKVLNIDTDNFNYEHFVDEIIGSIKHSKKLDEFSFEYRDARYKIDIASFNEYLRKQQEERLINIENILKEVQDTSSYVYILNINNETIKESIENLLKEKGINPLDYYNEEEIRNLIFIYSDLVRKYNRDANCLLKFYNQCNKKYFKAVHKEYICDANHFYRLKNGLKPGDVSYIKMRLKNVKK